jgi:hypothetical protein
MKHLLLAIPLAVVAAIMLVPHAGCTDPNEEVGWQLPVLKKIVASLADKPAGRYPATVVAVEICPPRLAQIYADGKGAYVFEFFSETTIDRNPAYAYVPPGTPDPDAAAYELCCKAATTYFSPCKEPGWYRAYGQ